MDPVTLGTLAAAAFKGIFDIFSVGAANRYNSPLAMKRRLRQAGLPLAYMYQGKVAQQSEVPKLSIDPDLGQVEKLGLHQQDTMNQANIKKIGAEVVGITQRNQKEKGELDWLNKISPEGNTNQEYNLEIDQSRKLAERFIAEHNSELKQIATWVETNLFADGIQIQERLKNLEKVKQQIINMIAQSKLMGQLFDIRKVEQTVNEMIGRKLQDSGDFATGLYAVLIKLFSKL